MTPLFPCASRSLCVDDANPFANLSSEASDGPTFIGLSFGVWPFRPPLGSNWRVDSCLGVCESKVSAADAFFCAARNELACVATDEGVPPQYPLPTSGGENGNGPIDPPTTPRQLFGNDALLVSAECPDGLPFTVAVAANLVSAPSRTQANAIAQSYGQQDAERLMFCLSDISTRATCRGEFYSQVIIATGRSLFPALFSTDFHQTPLSFVIVDGSLPTGLQLTTTGPNTCSITGTPTGFGNTFTLRATATDGSYMQKVYSIQIVGIVDSSPLPNFTQNVAYLHQFTATGFVTSYTWAVASGTLPTGLSLSASGILSGTPTSAATAIFTATVTDATGNNCSRQFSLANGAPPVNCDATTNWFNPGVCRLRIQGYVNGVIGTLNAPCGASDAGAGAVWDGTFNVWQTPGGPGTTTFYAETIDLGYADGFGSISAAKKVYLAFVNWVTTGTPHWELEIQTTITGILSAMWRGDRTGGDLSSPLGSYGPVTAYVNGACNPAPAFLTVEAYKPPTPVVTALLQDSVFVGDTLNITGSGFRNLQGASTVKINGVTATATFWNDANIAVTVPVGATTGNVVVTVVGVDSNAICIAVADSALGALTYQIPGYNAASFDLSGCVTFASANPAWTGTFVFWDGFFWVSFDWNSSFPSPFSLNGKLLDSCYMWLDHCTGGVGVWMVEIWVANDAPSSSPHLAWHGEKTGGTTPVGTYTRTSGCSPGPASLAITQI